MEPIADSAMEGDGSLLLQSAYIDLRFMLATCRVGKIFNPACSLKDFGTAARAFDKYFCIIPFFGDGTVICRPKAYQTPKIGYQSIIDISLV
jgi:hypothetical protein